MSRQVKRPQSPVLTNPNRGWVLKELEKLYREWTAWALVVEKIVDQPYNAQTQSGVFADGEDKMKAHEILQAKTLAFLNANIQGHGFIDGFDGHGCDRTDLRLTHRVKHRLQRLDILRASLKYAATRVPEENAPPIGVQGFLRKHWQWIIGAILVPIAIAIFL